MSFKLILLPLVKQEMNILLIDGDLNSLSDQYMGSKQVRNPLNQNNVNPSLLNSKIFKISKIGSIVSKY